MENENKLNDKYKNTIIEYIPRIINRISNVNGAWILVGRKIFKNINILLLNVNQNITCDDCTISNRCLNIIDIPEYLSEKIKSTMIDVYIPYLDTISDPFVKKYGGNKIFNDNVRMHFYNFTVKHELNDMMFISRDYYTEFYYCDVILKSTNMSESIAQTPINIKRGIYFFFIHLNNFRKKIEYTEDERFSYKKFFDFVIDKSGSKKNIDNLEKEYNSNEIGVVIQNIKKNFNNIISDNIIEEHNMEEFLKLTIIYDKFIPRDYDEKQFYNLMMVLKNNLISINNLKIFNENMYKMFRIYKNYLILLSSLRMLNKKKQSNVIIINAIDSLFSTHKFLLYVYLQTKLFKIKYINKWDDNICVELN